MLKSEIVTRLIIAGHITIEEAVVLMEKEVVYHQPYNPLIDPFYPPSVIYGTGNGTYATNTSAYSYNVTNTLTKN